MPAAWADLRCCHVWIEEFVVFVTYSSNLQGRFSGFDSTRLLWSSIELNPAEYYFLVEGCGLVDGCFGPWVRLLSTVKELDSLCNGKSVEAHSITQVQLLAPGVMTNRSGLSVELLSEIRVQPGTEENPVYEFITGMGHIYTSSRK